MSYRKSDAKAYARQVMKGLCPLTDAERARIREAFEACGLGKLPAAATR